MVNPLSFLGSLFTKAFAKAKAFTSYLTSPSEATGDKESLLPKKGNEPPQPAQKLSPEQQRQMAFENAIYKASSSFNATTEAIDKNTTSKTSSSAPSKTSSRPIMAEPTGSGNVPQEEVERVQQAIRAQIGLDQSSPYHRSIQQIIAGKDSETPQIISETTPMIKFQVEAPTKVAFKKTSGQGTDNQTSVTSENTVLTENSRNASEILSRDDPSSWRTYANLIAERNAKNGIGQDKSKVVGPVSSPKPQEEERPSKTYNWRENLNSRSRDARTNVAVQSTTTQRSTNRTNVSSDKENVNPEAVTKKAEKVEKVEKVKTVETTKTAPTKSSKAQESSGAQESSKVPNNRATSRTLPALTKENLAELTASQNNNPKPKARSNSSSGLNPSSGLGSGSGSNPRSGSSLSSNPSSGSGSGSGSSFSPNPSFSSGSGSGSNPSSGSTYRKEMRPYDPEKRLMDKKEEEEYNAKKAFATQQRLRARVTKEGNKALADILNLHAIRVSAYSDAQNKVFVSADVNPAPKNPRHQPQSEKRKPETLHRLANGPALKELQKEGWEVPYGHHATSPKGGGGGKGR